MRFLKAIQEFFSRTPEPDFDFQIPSNSTHDMETQREIDERINKGISIDDISYFYNDIFSKDVKFASLLVRKACNIEELSNLDHLIKLDRVIRQRSHYPSSSKRWTKTIEYYFPPNLTDEEKRVFTGLASLSPSGFCREQAVRYMSQNPHPYYIPYATLRMNDWVMQVSSKAEALFFTLLKGMEISELTSFLPCIDHINNYKRNQYTSLRKEVLEVIQSKASSEVLLYALQAVPDRYRYALVRLFLESKSIDTILASKILNEEKSPVVRYLVYNTLHKNEWPYSVDETIAFLKKEKFYRAKVILLNRISIETGDEITAAVSPFIADSSFLIRCQARDILRNNGINSFVKMYKDNCKSGFKVRNSLIGLSEANDPQSSTFITSYLEDEDQLIVASALRALLNLKIPVSFQDLKRYLLSRTQYLSKTAKLYIGDSCSNEQYSELVDEFEKEHPLYVYDYLFTIIGYAPKWDKVYIYYSLLSTTNEYIASQTKRFINEWFGAYNNSFYDPTPKQFQKFILLPDSIKRYHDLEALLESVRCRVK